ncbi:MAG: hypothetical protein FRX49_09647 [Trebouxia sp. A1-2]|nr:MAG: hypothetical protein FRX49_09647 [Trebouxia sp. A1-2]
MKVEQEPSKRWALGFSRGSLLYSAAETLVSVCGNCLSFHDQQTAKQGLAPQLHIHNTSDLSLLQKITWGTQAGYVAIAFSGDGKRLAAVEQEQNSRLVVWDWQESTPLFTGESDHAVSQLSFHPSDPDLLCTVGDSGLSLWHVDKHAGQSQLQQVPVQMSGLEPTSYAWLPQSLYIGCASGSVVIVDTVTASKTRQQAQRSSQAGAVPGPALGPQPVEDLPGLGTAEETSLPVVAALEYGGQLIHIEALAVNKDCVAVAGHCPIIRLFSHSDKGGSLSLLHELDLCVVGISSLAFGGTHHTSLAVGSMEATTHMVQLTHSDDGLPQPPQVSQLGQYHVGKVHASGALPDSRHIATAGEDGSIRLWNVYTHRCTAKRTFSSAQLCLASSMKTSLVALGSDSGVVRLIDAAAPSLTVVFRARLCEGPITCMAFSPDAKALAVVAGNRVWFVGLGSVPKVAKAVGYTEVPAPVLSIAWVQQAKPPLLLVSLAPQTLLGLSPDLASAAQGGGLRLSAAAVPSASLSLDQPLLHMVTPAASTDAAPVILGMSPDRILKRYTLPKEAAGALSTSTSGQLLLVGSADGSLMVQPCRLDPSSPRTSQPVLHDMWAGGISSVSFSATGEHCLTAGLDGAVLLHTMQESGQAHLSQLPVQAPALGDAQDMDILDDDAEATEEVRHAESLKQQPTQEALLAQQNTLDKLASIHEHAQQLLHQNEQAAQREQLPHQDLVVDVVGMGRLKALGESRVAALRESILRAGLEQTIIWGRLKELGWDCMQVHQTTLTGIKSDVEVSNFAVPKSSEQDVLMDKLVLLHEKDLTQPPPQLNIQVAPSNAASLVGQQSLNSLASPSPQQAPPPSIFARTLPRSQFAPGPRGSAMPSGSESLAGATSSLEQEEAQRLGFGEGGLTPSGRQILQAHVLHQEMSSAKADFNARFEATQKSRQADVDKILDANNRIKEICDEQTRQGTATGEEALFKPQGGLDDVENSVLYVQDSEVHVPRYLSAKDKARLAEEAAEEEARAKANAGNDMAVRALKQMMNGSPAGLPGGAAQVTLARPPWMEGDPSQFTPEQQQEVKIWEEKAKALVEERAKQRSALETELRTLKAAQDDIAARFDESLLALQTAHLEKELHINQLELQKLKLNASADRLKQLSPSAELTLQTQLAEAESSFAAKQNEMADVTAQLQDHREVLAALQQDDKALDKAWKKESTEAGEALGHTLYQLFKKRQRQSHGTDAQAASSTDPSDRNLFPSVSEPLPDDESALAAASVLDESSDRPAELTDVWWRRLNEVRQQKLEFEYHIRKQQAAVATTSSYQESLQADVIVMEAAQSSKVAQLALFQEEQKRVEEDIYVPLRLKQGQVEIQPQGIVDTGMDDAVLMALQLVQGLNQGVTVEGKKKVDVLRATKDFKKGIYGLQWEHTRGNMEVANLMEVLRELQLLRVTREVQAVISKGGPNGGAVGAGTLHLASQELQTMENLMKLNDRLNMKNVKEREAKLARLGQTIQERHQQNTKLLKEVEQVKSKLDVTAPTSLLPAKKSESPHARRMRNLATQRQLRDIAAMQQERMAQLQAEIDNLHRRSYPSFALRTNTYPDEIARIL